MSELLELLSIAHKLTPELRFCQLLMNIGIIKHTVEFDDKGLATPTNFDSYNYSDDKVIKLIEDYIENHKKNYKEPLSNLKDIIQAAKDNGVEFEDPEEDRINWEAIREKPLAANNGGLDIMYIYRNQREGLPIYYKLYIATDDISMDFIPHEYLRYSDGRLGQTCYKEGMYFHDVKRQFYKDNKNK